MRVWSRSFAAPVPLTSPLTARRVRRRHTIDGDRQRGGLEDDLDVLLGRGRLQGEANDDLRLAVLAGLLISAEERRQWVSCDAARRVQEVRGATQVRTVPPATHLYFLPSAPPSTSPAFLAARSAWFFCACCCSGLPPMPPMFAIIEAMSSMPPSPPSPLLPSAAISFSIMAGSAPSMVARRSVTECGVRPRRARPSAARGDSADN